MDTSAHVGSSNKRAPAVLLSDRFYQDCLNTLGSAGEDAAMVLDDRGEVIYCNRKCADILGCKPDGMTGRHINDFVLNMRLSAETPGSNVAYARHTGRWNQWREYCILDSDGQSFPVELLLDVLVVDLRYLILLWVRTPMKRTDLKEWPVERQLRDSGIFNRSAAIAA